MSIYQCLLLLLLAWTSLANVLVQVEKEEPTDSPVQGKRPCVTTNSYYAETCSTIAAVIRLRQTS